ncbi:hypothetical protein LY76DRAFT_80600 [Colletotrichum caudatum]|nr:hypothetical protein LY76DRAFT_80600 [Colletotrichum caudatum]
MTSVLLSVQAVACTVFGTDFGSVWFPTTFGAIADSGGLVAGMLPRILPRGVGPDSAVLPSLLNTKVLGRDDI